MTPDSHHRRFGPLMWGAIGVTFIVLAVVAVSGLDARIAGFVVGALVISCLAICGVAYWLDNRAWRRSTALLEQFRLSKR